MKSMYTDSLMDAVAGLESVKNKLFNHAINVGMQGVYADLNKVFEPGDSYQFELGHFDETDDESLQTLVNLIKHIDHTSQKILKINNLRQEEIDV